MSIFLLTASEFYGNFTSTKYQVLLAKCQDIDNPGFGLGCVNTPITRIKVRGPKREATGRVSKEPVPRQNKPGFDASE
jgi:hypothetical protein